MKRRYIITSLSSLVLGIVLTALFTAQMSHKSFGDCADLTVPLPSAIRRIDCAGLNYGFPMRFVQSQPNLQVRTADETNNTPVLLDVTADTTIDWAKLAGNIVFWSILCAIVAMLAQAKFSKKELEETPKPKAKNK